MGSDRRGEEEKEGQLGSTGAYKDKIVESHCKATPEERRRTGEKPACSLP